MVLKNKSLIYSYSGDFCNLSAIFINFTAMADVGRPTLYKTEYCEQVEKFCKLGATDAEIADFFNIAESTLNNWKIEHPEFMESIKKGKIIADSEVAEKLYQRATGYCHPDVDIKVIDSEIVITNLVKHYPPDTAAAFIWLKNRRNMGWKDKQEQEMYGKDGESLNFNITMKT